MRDKNNYPSFLSRWQPNLSWLRLPHQEFLFNQEELNPLNRRLFYLNLGLIIISVLVISLSYFFLPPLVPLFYSLPEGQEELASKWQLFYLPSIMFILTLVAAVIDRKMEFSDEIISRSLFGSTLLFNLILFISLIEIIWLVI